MIAPRENGSLLGADVVVPEHRHDAEGGPQPLELLDHLPRSPGMAHDVAGQGDQVSAALHAEVDALPKRTHVERRRPGVQVAQVKDREAVELAGEAGDADVQRPAFDPLRLEETPGRCADSGGRQGAERSVSTPHARSRARRAGDLAPGRSARAACSGGLRRPNGRCRTRRSARPVGPGTRLRRPLQLLRGGGRESSACGDSTRMRPTGPSLPGQPGARARRTAPRGGGVGRTGGAACDRMACARLTPGIVSPPAGTRGEGSRRWRFCEDCGIAFRVRPESGWSRRWWRRWLWGHRRAPPTRGRRRPRARKCARRAGLQRVQPDTEVGEANARLRRSAHLAHRALRGSRALHRPRRAVRFGSSHPAPARPAT